MKEIDKNNIVRDRLKKARRSPIRSYIDFSVGKESLFFFIKYDIITSLFGSLPGALGFFFRKIFYPGLFKQTGKNLIIGRSVVIRHPKKITIGDNVTIDDYCFIDARGSGEDGIVLEDEIIINRNSSLYAKGGGIRLGRRTSLGSYSHITSLEKVELGDSVLTGGGCYFSSGTYSFENTDLAVMDQTIYSKGPIIVGKNCYFGAKSTVVGGLTIGSNAIIGAGSVVLKDIPSKVVVAGVPAKIIKELP